MQNTQRPSGMPIHKYRPFHEQITVELPDRTWPTKRITEAPRWCAVDLRDGGEPFGGLDVTRAVANVQDTIAPALLAFDAADQSGLDARLGELDGTPDKRRLGGNATIAVSMAAAHAAAAAAVDAHPADAGRGDERDFRQAVERRLGELLEDRRGYPPALRAMAHRPRLIVTDIDAGNDIGRAADEPHIGRARGRPRLAEQRPVEIAQHQAVTVMVDQRLRTASRCRHHDHLDVSA